ncbi:hypothetical protein FRC11_015070, partial [Ceratobasidium sp. 423]
MAQLLGVPGPWLPMTGLPHDRRWRFSVQHAHICPQTLPKHMGQENTGFNPEVKESTHKRKGRESTEADKRDRDNKKITAKARKTRHKEAKEDDLLMEHKGESSDVSQLCILALHLESDNQHMRAQLMRHDKARSSLPTYPVALLAKRTMLGGS